MMTTATTKISIELGTACPLNAFETGEAYPGESKPVLSPGIRGFVDRKIAISQKQFKNGQYTRFDDAFVREFLEEAYKRNEKVFRGE